jgi:hypothetical protein
MVSDTVQRWRQAYGRGGGRLGTEGVDDGLTAEGRPRSVASGCPKDGGHNGGSDEDDVAELRVSG